MQSWFVAFEYKLYKPDVRNITIKTIIANEKNWKYKGYPIPKNENFYLK